MVVFSRFESSYVIAFKTRKKTYFQNIDIDGIVQREEKRERLD